MLYHAGPRQIFKLHFEDTACGSDLTSAFKKFVITRMLSINLAKYLDGNYPPTGRLGKFLKSMEDLDTEK